MVYDTNDYKIDDYKIEYKMVGGDGSLGGYEVACIANLYNKHKDKITGINVFGGNYVIYTKNCMFKRSSLLSALKDLDMEMFAKDLYKSSFDLSGSMFECNSHKEYDYKIGQYVKCETLELVGKITAFGKTEGDVNFYILDDDWEHKHREHCLERIT